uniref:Uncharacterized protein n=1 Tax=Branchiostoma floridae TaxID=7739 RepID=C3YTM9_BRAFL|eukprot:XP_002600144.1 hypothetical protein BRAFLDRAFT_66652 [Branchiostoma floridae]
MHESASRDESYDDVVTTPLPPETTTFRTTPAPITAPPTTPSTTTPPVPPTTPLPPKSTTASPAVRNDTLRDEGVEDNEEGMIEDENVDVEGSKHDIRKTGESNSANLAGDSSVGAVY